MNSIRFNWPCRKLVSRRCEFPVSCIHHLVSEWQGSLMFWASRCCLCWIFVPCRSMLMGLYPPTSGTIIINDKNLQTDLSKVREELGVCPQQDILLANLTVREHLMLFAAIKAPWWTKKELQHQVDKLVNGFLSPLPIFAQSCRWRTQR